MDGGRDRGFGASRGTRQKNNAPDRPAENAMVAFSAAMADASAMRGWAAGACHMLDDERSLWAVVVIGGFAASRGPAEKIIGPRQVGRKCDGRIFRRDG